MPQLRPPCAALRFRTISTSASTPSVRLQSANPHLKPHLPHHPQSHIKLTVKLAHRAFSTSRAPRAGSPLFALPQLSTSRETAYLSRGKKIPRTEYSPVLSLIKSGEIDQLPFDRTTRDDDVGSESSRAGMILSEGRNGRGGGGEREGERRGTWGTPVWSTSSLLSSSSSASSATASSVQGVISDLRTELATLKLKVDSLTQDHATDRGGVRVDFTRLWALVLVFFAFNMVYDFTVLNRLREDQTRLQARIVELQGGDGSSAELEQEQKGREFVGRIKGFLGNSEKRANGNGNGNGGAMAIREAVKGPDASGGVLPGADAGASARDTNNSPSSAAFAPGATLTLGKDADWALSSTAQNHTRGNAATTLEIKEKSTDYDDDDGIRARHLTRITDLRAAVPDPLTGLGGSEERALPRRGTSAGGSGPSQASSSRLPVSRISKTTIQDFMMGRCEEIKTLRL